MKLIRKLKIGAFLLVAIVTIVKFTFFRGDTSNPEEQLLRMSQEEREYCQNILGQITSNWTKADVVSLLGKPSRDLWAKKNWWVTFHDSKARVGVYFTSEGYAEELVFDGDDFYYRRDVFASAPNQSQKTPEKEANESDPPLPPPEGMVWIPGGTFQMGCELLDGGMPDESPVHTVELDGFYMDQTEVTNAQFAKFVEATGYVTMAERKPELRSLKPDAPKLQILPDERFNKPGSMCLNPKLNGKNFVPEKGAYNWWDYLPGANWRQPEGPGSSIKDRMDHPVVHVAWLDAKAYCDWAGKKLPTEAQWEYAARGGSEQRVYPWGNTRNPQGKWLHNIWQGDFPIENTEEDGYRGTAPVGSFQPNGFELYDTSGNVWEWVADYYRPDYYQNSPRKNPPGPKSSLDPQEPFIIKRVQRGGSFMCSDSYCIAYRNSARMKGEEDTGAFHTGFRCVMTPEMLKEREKSAKPQTPLQHAR